MLVLLVVLTPPFLFFLVERFFSSPSLPLVNCRRRCRSSLFLYLVFFFLSFSLSSVHPLKSTVPVAITSFLFFSLSFLRREKEKKKKITTTATHRTTSGAKMYTDRCFYLLTTLFADFSSLPSTSYSRRTVFSSILSLSLSRLMTKKSDLNETSSIASASSNVMIIQQQQPMNEQQQHFVLPAVNNSAPMIITTPLGRNPSLCLFVVCDARVFQRRLR